MHHGKMLDYNIYLDSLKPESKLVQVDYTGAIIDKFNGGPVGVESLSVAISEDPVTIEEVYEPYLIKEGYIQRTTRGRIALDKAHKYCDKIKN